MGHYWPLSAKKGSPSKYYALPKHVSPHRQSVTMSSTSNHAITNVPQEIWDKIADHLPAFDAMNAAKGLRFKLRSQQEKHSKVWHAIFRDTTWITKATTEYGLNPLLIGCDLYDCYADDFPQAQSTYLVLVAGDRTGDLRFEKDMFLESLKPHKFHKEALEVEFETGMTLNIANVYEDPEIIPLRPNRIFSRPHEGLDTAVMWWQESTLRTLNHRNMVGIWGTVTSLQQVLNICGLTLNHPHGHVAEYTFEERPWQGRAVELTNEPERGI